MISSWSSGESYWARARRERASDTSPARELQLIAIERLPLLTGNLEDDGQSISVWGRAIARDGLHRSTRFYINGLPFEETDYPVREDGTRLFSEFGGVTGFKAYTRAHYAQLKDQRWWRIDAAPFGVFLPYAWRSAWWFPNPALERHPQPSAAKMRRVIGDDSAVRFTMGGLTIFQNVTQTLQEFGVAWSTVRRVLDWGCGSGRITRYLLSAAPEIEVHGADIDADNIAWCTANLAPGRFAVVRPEPPTDYADGAFDVVIGASVMTHLKEDMQFSWLQELHRITRPGAWIFLSISGACQFAHMGISPALYKSVQERGYVDSGRDPALDGFVPGTDYYRSAWHSHRYVIEKWNRFFDVVTIADGTAALQDFVVMRRRGD